MQKVLGALAGTHLSPTHGVHCWSFRTRLDGRLCSWVLRWCEEPLDVRTPERGDRLWPWVGSVGWAQTDRDGDPNPAMYCPDNPVSVGGVGMVRCTDSTVSISVSSTQDMSGNGCSWGLIIFPFLSGSS